MQTAERRVRRILVSGSTGFLGTAVVAALRARRDEVVPLLRGPGAETGVRWNADGELDPASVRGFDAVVHLAGEPVATGRWTATKKRRIRDSRIEGTQKLVAALAASGRPPGVLVCASGINFYGDGGDRIVDEGAPAGGGFLAEVCTGWEAAAAALAPVSRVVQLRIGVVLDPSGGTLKLMLPLFRMGLAGPVAGGRAFVPWVTLHDLVRAVIHAVDSATLQGPTNVCSPEPVRGRQFTADMAAATGRPARLPVPGWAVRLLMGQMAEETVLASVRAVPQRLLQDGFTFDFPLLPAALAAMPLASARPVTVS